MQTGYGRKLALNEISQRSQENNKKQDIISEKDKT